MNKTQFVEINQIFNKMLCDVDKTKNVKHIRTSFIDSIAFRQLLFLSAGINCLKSKILINIYSKNRENVITENPTFSSKGFENTFKLLKLKLETTVEKSMNLLPSSLNSEFPLSFVFPMVLNYFNYNFELELADVKRLGIHKQDLSIVKKEDFNLLMPLYCNFVPKEFESKFFTPRNKKLSQNQCAINDDIMYHATISPKGKRCLRIIRSLIKNQGIVNVYNIKKNNFM